MGVPFLLKIGTPTASFVESTYHAYQSVRSVKHQPGSEIAIPIPDLR